MAIDDGAGVGSVEVRFKGLSDDEGAPEAVLRGGIDYPVMRIG